MNETPKELVILKGLLSNQTIGVVQVPKQNSNTLTKEVLHEIFEYRDGDLYWKIKVANKKVGDKAGTLDKFYKRVSIKDRYYSIHRVIFIMFYGYAPNIIDHIDGNGFNNRIENLREATPSQNQWNRKLGKNNSSGVKGVSYDSKRKKYCASSYLDKKSKNIGRFNTLDEAKNALKEFRLKHHGEFAKY